MEDILVAQPLISLDTPEFAVAPQYRIPVNHYPAQMMPIPPSRMFLIRDALNKYKAKMGADAVTYDASQGDGGASLPGVPREILEKALELQIAQGTAYDQPWGTVRFRKAAAQDYWHLDAETGWSGENIAFVQGGRDGLLKAYQAMVALTGSVGDALVVSRVPWISYNWGPYAVGLNVLLAPGYPEEGWRYTPEAIRVCAEFAAREGRKIAGIVITSPDNPTGRTIPVEEQILLARTALESGYGFVLFDWIYHWVTESGQPSDINAVLKAFSPDERERLIFLDGITKSLGASNIRSAHLVAGKKVIAHLTSQASHGVLPAFYAQAVAIAAYEMGFAKACASITQPTNASRQALRRELTAQGARFIMGDGYYAFIDCTPYIERGGLTDSEALLTYLGENYGVVVVPGIYFSQAGANWVRFSYALPAEKTAKAIKRMFEGLNVL
jgi:aspartate/methionine/tyrosine aminotransferase